MKDSRSSLYSILSSTGYNVCEGWPAVIAGPFPMITYFDSDHEAADYQDGISHLDLVEYTIDFWENEPYQDIHYAVDKLLRQNGYYRAMYVRQFEEDTKLQHVSTKYKKVEVEDIV